MNRGLAWSAGVHVALFVAFLLGPSPKPFEWNRADAVAVELVSVPKATPVKQPTPTKLPTPEPDPVRAPDPTPPQPVKEVAPPQETPKETPKETPVLKDPQPKPVKPVAKPQPQRVIKKYAPPKSTEPSLAERLKSRLDTLEPSPDAKPAEPVPTGGETAQASAEVEAVDFPYAWYINVILSRVTAAWDPPGQAAVSGRNRQATVRFRIHRDGRITDVRVIDASGTPGLDASAARAIERGGPYPPLPDTYEADLLDLGIRFNVGEGS